MMSTRSQRSFHFANILTFGHISELEGWESNRIPKAARLGRKKGWRGEKCDFSPLYLSVFGDFLGMRVC